jgi:hypothetical protein
MAEVDLSKLPGASEAPATETKPTEAAPAETAVVPAAEAAIAKPDELLVGDIVPTMQDIILPRLNIVQGVGQLKDRFPQGAIVHGQSSVFFEPTIVDPGTGQISRQGTKPLVVTAIGFRPVRFVEKVPGGGRGMIVSTEAEVRKQGGTLSWQEWDLKKDSGMKRFEYMAEAMIAIERPEQFKNDDSVFSFPCEGKQYAIAMWSMKGTAYTSACKRGWFYHKAAGCLRGKPVFTYSFSLSTRLENNGKNTYWVPVVVPLEQNTEGFQEFAKSINAAPKIEQEDTGD